MSYRIKKVISILLLILLAQSVFSQLNSHQRDSYIASARAYRELASKTKCPDRARVLEEYAKWSDCMVKSLVDGARISCPKPTTPIPPCDGDIIGGSSNNSGSSASTNSSAVKEMQLKQNNLQQDLNNAQSAASQAFDNALNNGKKTSGALLEATISGAQSISDPKTSLAFSGIGLSTALISWISEKKEAQRAAMKEREEADRISRLNELTEMKKSLNTNSAVFTFLSGSTEYHVTNLKIDIKRGMVKSILRKDLYDVAVEIHKLINTVDTIYIFESVKFRNLSNSTDSCVISKVSIPIRALSDVQVYNGNFTNSYDPKTSADQIFRHKSLTNQQLKEAFTIIPVFNERNAIGAINSQLLDLEILTLGNRIKIHRRYSNTKPATLNDNDFKGVTAFFTNKYMLVFTSDGENFYKPFRFTEYLNFIKP